VDRVARTEAEFGEVRVYKYEWWHLLNRVDFADTAAGRHRLAALSSPFARALESCAVGEPLEEVARDAMRRRGLVVDNPRWYSTSPPPPGSPGQHGGSRLKFVAPEVCLTDGDGVTGLVRQRLLHRDLGASPGDAAEQVQELRVVAALPHFDSNPADRAWWLVTEPFGQDRVSAAELLSTTEWWGGTIDVDRGRTQSPIGDEGRGSMVAHVLRCYLEAKREWGTFEAAYVGRALAGLRKDDSAEALVEACHAIDAGLPARATGRALADYCGHGGGGLSAAGARLRDILELGGNPAWVCDAAAGFVLGTPEPPRDSTETLTAWATALVMTDSWRPDAPVVEALASYAKGSSLRAQAAREIIAAHMPSDG
jgi:hypothetical protein